MAEQQPIISLEQVCFWRGQKEILHDINLTVERGDFITMTGPNGGGKTTLLRIILKLLKPQLGRVTYHNYGQQGGKPELTIGYLPQKNMIDSRFPLTVKEVIASGLLTDNRPRENKEELVESTIHLIGLEAKSRSPIGELSGGQLQRVLLGRALVASPDVLVLDEPLSYVDKAFESKIYRILNSLRTRTTILLVSHELSELSSMANKHLIIDHTLRHCRSESHSVRCDCESIAASSCSCEGTNNTLSSHNA